MMDAADRAAQFEMAHQQQALRAHFASVAEPKDPKEVNGIRYCLHCGDDIPKARLNALPESVHCIECKTIEERQEAQHA